MEPIKIQLSGLWVALVLTNLYGDVLRMMSGDVARMPETHDFTQLHWLAAAALMAIPIIMVYCSLTLSYSLNRWANIIFATAFFLLTATSLHTYPSMYDKFLLCVGLVFNVLTVWQAWHWKA
ncbi:MAG: hypothetical protein H9535_17445 [Ignavibacteria bacterium]|nr:hypothetical protein [Ignavibacteria bacterium]